MSVELSLEELGTNTGMKSMATSEPDDDYKDLLYVCRSYISPSKVSASPARRGRRTTHLANDARPEIQWILTCQSAECWSKKGRTSHNNPQVNPRLCRGTAVV